MTRRVLLIDDEIAFLFPMQKMLAGAGLVVDTAESYERAIARLESCRYDAVIADVRLGGAMSREGLAILDHVRSQDDQARVIIMTGFGSSDVMCAAYRKKADCYFEKPVSFRMLADALVRLGVLAPGPEPAMAADGAAANKAG